MKKLENLDLVNDTSFHFITINTSIKKLTKALGEPTIEDNTGEDKVNIEWDVITKDGVVGTIYDWKEYRRLGENEIVQFHIGGNSKEDTLKIKSELMKLL
jgi:hypothetical protein